MTKRALQRLCTLSRRGWLALSRTERHELIKLERVAGSTWGVHGMQVRARWYKARKEGREHA